MSKSSKSATLAMQALNAQTDTSIVNERLRPHLLSEFSLDKDALKLALVTAQFALRETRQQNAEQPNKPTALLVLVNGMEQAGKGTAVNQLRQSVDPRLLKVEATIGSPPLAYQPIWQAHTKAIPRHGDVMVYFGNWYADLIYNIMRIKAMDKDSENADTHSCKLSDEFQAIPSIRWQTYLQQQLIELQAFERDLADNQTKLLKCWFHVDADTLQQRLNNDDIHPRFLYQINWHDKKVLAQFNRVATAILRQQGDWVIIDGADKEQAAISFSHEVLNAMQVALMSSLPDTDAALNAALNASDASKFEPVKIPKQLVNMKTSDLSKSDYTKRLANKQAKLAKLLRARNGRHVVFAFEGMDAAGKGGAIKRLVAPLDPREYRVHNIGAPMMYELQHPYLWRFWTHLPDDKVDRISRIAIFDRTWYGRVLVERVESFAQDYEWQRAYDEINRFEAGLSAAGTLVIKYWLAIDKKEQLKRFEARGETPHKQFKLTDDDWRNRDKWTDYVQAAADMLARTNTDVAPWCIIATNDKRRARLDVLDHAIAQLKSQL